MIKSNNSITRQSAVRSLLAFLIILLMMPLGHAFVILMGNHLRGATLKWSAGALGFIGVCLALSGNRLPGKAMRILCGCFGAILFWGAWVEFVYICYSNSLAVPPLMNGSEIFIKPEYRMMPSSVPFAILAFLMYLYLAPTRWGVMLFLRKCLKIKDVTDGGSQSESMRAFIELILLIWWCYLILLVEFDPEFFGPHHAVTLITATICLVASIILIVRSLRAPDWASALRQAIVNVCVLWTFVEVMIKLKLFTEIWIYPERYVTEMILILAAFIISILLMSKLGHKNIRR